MKRFLRISCLISGILLSINVSARPTVELPTSITPTENSSTLSFEEAVVDLRSQAAKDSIRTIFDTQDLYFSPQDYDSVHGLATYNVYTVLWRLKENGATAQDSWVKRLMIYLYWYNNYVNNTLFMGTAKLSDMDRAM